MIKVANKKDCCGCHACYNICPQSCIDMKSDSEGFWYPNIDKVICTDCGLCEKVCPVINKTTINNNPVAYACINKDIIIREQSSSGGIFSLLAENVINNNGVVFGARFDDSFNVVHSWTDTFEGLNSYRGSKYLQSSIGDTYKEVRNFLKDGRQVLFSGTPCQIYGLKSFLGKSYANLLCIDIICHGVPSPLVWQKYVENHEKKSGSRAERIAFRRKNCGWKLYSVSFSFENNTEYSKTLKEDLFMQGFLKDIYLRPSCYHCNFKTLNRVSDITLADFWGVGNILPSFDDDMGTSLVLVNSNKGNFVFSSVADDMVYEEVNINKAISYNPSAIKSVAYNPKRELFFKELSNLEDIEQLIIKYTRVSLPIKMYLKIRRILSGVKRRIIRL